MAKIEVLKPISGPLGALCNSLASDTSRRSLHIKDERRERWQMVAIECTRVLLGSFRKCDADDPEIYSRCIENELARYDPEIQREVCDPGKWKWQPKVQEICEACEKIANERARVAKREAALADQLAERRRLDALQPERKALPCSARNSPRRFTKIEQERREAERILARYKAEASVRHPEMPSVFEMAPETWDT